MFWSYKMLQTRFVSITFPDSSDIQCPSVSCHVLHIQSVSWFYNMLLYVLTPRCTSFYDMFWKLSISNFHNFSNKFWHSDFSSVPPLTDHVQDVSFIGLLTTIQLPCGLPWLIHYGGMHSSSILWTCSYLIGPVVACKKSIITSPQLQVIYIEFCNSSDILKYPYFVCRTNSETRSREPI